MAALNLFPARIRFVNEDGTLTPEAFRALQIVFGRVGGALGDTGTDVFGQVFGAPTDSANNLSNALSDVVQPVAFGSDYYGDVVQSPASSKDLTDCIFDEVTQPFPLNQTGQGRYVMDTSPTLITPKATTTLGVGNATPSASGSGVSFPATQSASTDPNTFDDYEEGTWTASMICTASGTVTLSANTGSYTKKGREVTVTGRFTVSSVSAPVGAINITGLPFAVAAGVQNTSACSIFAFNLAAGATTSIIANATAGTSTIEVYKYAAGAASNMAANVQATSVFIISCTYFTT